MQWPSEHQQGGLRKSKHFDIAIGSVMVLNDSNRHSLGSTPSLIRLFVSSLLMKYRHHSLLTLTTKLHSTKRCQQPPERMVLSCINSASGQCGVVGFQVILYSLEPHDMRTSSQGHMFKINFSDWQLGKRDWWCPRSSLVLVAFENSGSWMSLPPNRST